MGGRRKKSTRKQPVSARSSNWGPKKHHYHERQEDRIEGPGLVHGGYDERPITMFHKEVPFKRRKN